MKTYTKRKLTYYGEGSKPTVEVAINIYSQEGALTPGELKQAGDELSDRVMVAMNEAKYVHAPLSRINVQRNAK